LNNIIHVSGKETWVATLRGANGV